MKITSGEKKNIDFTKTTLSFGIPIAIERYKMIVMLDLLNLTTKTICVRKFVNLAGIQSTNRIVTKLITNFNQIGLL